jgi:hypothetical protein
MAPASASKDSSRDQVVADTTTPPSWRRVVIGIPSRGKGSGCLNGIAPAVSGIGHRRAGGEWVLEPSLGNHDGGVTRYSRVASSPPCGARSATCRLTEAVAQQLCRPALGAENQQETLPRMGGPR